MAITPWTPVEKMRGREKGGGKGREEGERREMEEEGRKGEREGERKEGRREREEEHKSVKEVQQWR